MGTNFYYSERPPCECCGREYPEVHIGKRSGGWKFSLQARDRNDTWAIIKGRILRAYAIWDEYGKAWSAEEMIDEIEGWQEGRSHVDVDHENAYTDSDGYVLCVGEFS